MKPIFGKRYWVPDPKGNEVRRFDDQYDEDDGPNTTRDIHGSGNSDPYGANYNCAVAEANKRGSATLYTVELTTTSKMQQFATDTKSTYLNGRSTEDLQNAFDKIAQEITRSYSFGNVIINDALSRWAEFAVAGGDAASEPTFTYQKGADGNLSEWGDAPKASYDSESGLITWDLSSVGVLEADTTYRVSFTIRPNQAAFDAMAETGAPEGETDSDTGATGFFSNANDRATLTYSRVTQENEGEPTYGDPQTVNYQHRVMNVPTSTLTIEKQWNGEGTKPESVDIVIKRDGNKWKTVTLNADSNWTADVIVAAGPTGHTYEIAEPDPGEGWTLDGITVNDKTGNSVELSGLTAQSAEFTVSNVPESFTLRVQKTDGTTHEVLHNAKFDLYRADKDGEFSEDSSLFTKGEIAPDADYADFSDLTAGIYYLVETYVPAGYQLNDEPYRIEVTADGIRFASSVDGEAQDATKVSGVDRTYQVSFENTKAAGGEIPSTGGMGDVPLYAAGVMAIAGSVTAVRKIKRH